MPQHTSVNSTTAFRGATALVTGREMTARPLGQLCHNGFLPFLDSSFFRSSGISSAIWIGFMEQNDRLA